MITRIISGIWYILLLAAAYCLKVFLPCGVGDFFVDALVYVFAFIGTYEILRALKDKTTKAERVIVYSFVGVCIPVTVFMIYVLNWGVTALGVCVMALIIVLLCLLVFQHDETSLESIGLSLLSALYPTGFLSLLVIANHAGAPAEYLQHMAFDSRLLILFVFLLVPAVDSFAYLFGKFLKKFFPQKLAPVLSPNKTIIGCIGGLIGGILAALVIYFLYNWWLGSFEQMGLWLTIYLLIGFVTSIATMLGDLVESCIKRKLHVKDMGDIMPGHGGILDRLDSTLYATVAVYGIYSLISLIFV